MEALQCLSPHSVLCPPSVSATLILTQEGQVGETELIGHVSLGRLQHPDSQLNNIPETSVPLLFGWDCDLNQ